MTSVKPKKSGHHKITTKAHNTPSTHGRGRCYHIPHYRSQCLILLPTMWWAKRLLDLSCGSAPVFFQPLVKKYNKYPKHINPKISNHCPPHFRHMPACRTINYIFLKGCATLQLNRITKKCKKTLKETSNIMHLRQVVNMITIVWSNGPAHFCVSVECQRIQFKTCFAAFCSFIQLDFLTCHIPHTVCLLFC